MSTLAQRVAFLEGVQRLFPGLVSISVTGYALRERWGFIQAPVQAGQWKEWIDEWRNGRDDALTHLIRVRANQGWKMDCIEFMHWPHNIKLVLSMDCRLYYINRIVYPVYRSRIVSRTFLLRPLRRAQNRLAVRKAAAVLLAKLPLVLVAEIAGFAFSHRARLPCLFAELQSTFTPSSVNG